MTNPDLQETIKDMELTVGASCNDIAELEELIINALTLLKAQQEQIAELEEAQQWISVQDELPEIDEVVLLSYGDEMLLDVWERVQDKYSHPELGWRWSGMNLDDMARVTHWLRIPAPPQTGDRE